MRSKTIIAAMALALASAPAAAPPKYQSEYRVPEVVLFLPRALGYL